ncbi:hypothetical protein GCM10009814_14350 [Lapillicoccus jejuensis]
MIDYNVCDHWADDTPAWVKSLVSSLDRNHGFSGVLPLTVIVSEIAEWLELASGVDAWAKSSNRRSLLLDLDQSVAAIGKNLTVVVSSAFAEFRGHFLALDSSPREVLMADPGRRTGLAWTRVLKSSQILLDTLKGDDAVRASWVDLVAASQDRSSNKREYRPIAEVLHDQLRLRGRTADGVFRDLASIVAYGATSLEITGEVVSEPIPDRLANAGHLVAQRPEEESIVVWMGYRGRIAHDLHAGSVAFFDAHWAVPNADPTRTSFPFKCELWEIVKYGFAFRVGNQALNEPGVDSVVRIDLGQTTAAGAFARAKKIVDTLLNVAIHRSGGIRPQLVEYHVLRSGVPAGSGHYALNSATGFPDDNYGAGITMRAIGRHVPRIAEALSRADLPVFLSAAVEVQVASEHPFSRDMALRTPSEADISSVVPLTDRVVQHVAAYAGMKPGDLFEALGQKWAHARWLTDVQRAVQMCLLGSGWAQPQELLHELTVEWFSERPASPWILWVEDRAEDLLSLCRLEHERRWIERMLVSVSTHEMYASLEREYATEGQILEARRTRVRNALVHGNPACFASIESVREYAEFASRSSLNIALESYVDGTSVAEALLEIPDDYKALKSGLDASSYWRERVAREGWPPSEL